MNAPICRAASLVRALPGVMRLPGMIRVAVIALAGAAAPFAAAAAHAQGAVASVDTPTNALRIETPLAPMHDRIAATESRCARASVLVTVDGGTGSGTMIDARGYVLTNHHVVAPVLVPGFDGPSVRARAHVRVQIPLADSLDASDVYEAEIVGADLDLDLALVRITGRPGQAPRDDLRFSALSLADGDALPTGTIVDVLGYPFGHRILTILSGRITGRREQTDGTVEWVTTDAPFNPGNSGGAVVDAECRLVGVPTQVFRGGLNPVNMARPIDTRVRAYIERVRGIAAGRAPAVSAAHHPAGREATPASGVGSHGESPREFGPDPRASSEKREPERPSTRTRRTRHG